MRVSAETFNQMKACVYIKTAKRGRSRGACLSLIKHCLSEGRSEPEYDDGNSRVVVLDAYGMAGQPDATRPADIRDNLLRNNHDSKSKDTAKHVVISVEDIADLAKRKAAMRVLRKMAFLFLKTYAPGCAAIAFGHLDRCHPHIHLCIANSDGSRALNWQPDTLRQMQSMVWLSRDLATIVQSGRRKPGKAKHEPYPGVRLSLAAELASLPQAELEQIPWEWRGSTRVFIFKKRRIRERTILREAERLRVEETTKQKVKNENDNRNGIGGRDTIGVMEPPATTAAGEMETVGRRNPPVATNRAAIAGKLDASGIANLAIVAPLAGALERLKSERSARCNEYPPTTPDISGPGDN